MSCGDGRSVICDFDQKSDLIINILHVRGFMFPLWLSVKPKTKREGKTKQKNVSVTGCFTIPFPCFPFCHFSIILGISVRQALFLKLPLFHRFLYFMISTSSSSVVQTEVETWGNQAATVTCKPQTGSCGTCMIWQLFSGGKSRSWYSSTQRTLLLFFFWITLGTPDNK